MSTLNWNENSVGAPPGWTCRLSEDEYHAAASEGKVLSSGMLKEFRLCPAHYHSLIQGRTPKRDSDAMRFGRAMHKLVLEGEAAFYAAYAVGGPINGRTGRSYGPASKAFDEWVRENGADRKCLVTHAEFDDMLRMLAAVRAHREIARLFKRGWAECSARMEMLGVPCQIRLDWLRDDSVAVDVKTIDDISRFEADARRFGYLHQFAFYRDAAREAGGADLEMTAVVVEKKAPFRAGVWVFAGDTLEPYAIQNREAIASLKRCREENRWPTGYEKPRSFPLAGIPPFWLN